MDFYHLYLDASGDEGWVPPYGNSSTNTYVLGGPALLVSQDRALGAEMQKVWDNISAAKPFPFHDFHFTDIRAKKRPPWNQLPLPAAARVLTDVLDIIAKICPPIFGTVIKKKSFKETWKDRAFDPRWYAFRGIVGRFQLFLEEKNAAGAIVIDSEGFQKEKKIRQELNTLKITGTRIGSPKTAALGVPNPIPKDVLNTVMFAPRSHSAGLQAADFVAAAVWQRYEKNRPEFEAAFSRCWRSRPSGSTEPTIIQ